LSRKIYQQIALDAKNIAARNVTRGLPTPLKGERSPIALTMRIPSLLAIGILSLQLVVMSLHLLQYLNDALRKSGRETLVLQNEAQNSSQYDRIDELLSPIVLPKGSVFYDGTQLTARTSECFNANCEAQANDSVERVMIPGDAISIYTTSPYFHFFFETVIQLFPLIENQIFEKHPNATILCFGIGYFSPRNIEMLHALDFQIPLHKARKGKPNILYSVGPLSSMIVARHNDYHSKTPQSVLYNRNVVNLIRRRLTPDTETPHVYLYVSREGIRRGIQQDRELYTGLKVIFPNLIFFLPDHYTVLEQRKMFKRSCVIIAPHGGSLVNVIFSNWDKLLLIELTLIERPATFRKDLDIRNYFLLKYPAAPCQSSRARLCDFLRRNMDVNVTMTVNIIQNIFNSVNDNTGPLNKDYVINGSNSM
jgi:Glycosyltransferase 61